MAEPADKRPVVPPFDSERVPRHIAIIMDGNGRWARERGQPRVMGHRAGVETVRRVLTACDEWGVGFLTLYAFSSENWNRPPAEVRALMLLLRRYLRREIDELDRKRVTLRVIGDLARLAPAVRRAVDGAVDRLAKNRGLTLTMALSYGGRDELARAVRRLAAEVAAGRLDPAQIDENSISERLDTAGLPDPDLLIRTAGEMRVSNFLLWQSSYSEYYSSDVCWPDFDRPHLAAAIGEFQRRKRKYGRIE